MESHFAIVVSTFNEEITRGLLSGCETFLKSQNVKSTTFKAPGAFEIPFMAKTLAKTGRYAGIVCIGCIIKGETAHFEYICQSVYQGLMSATLETDVPMSFGILTTYTVSQAKARAHISGPKSQKNKGKEAAKACYELSQLVCKIKN
jgi:6,7-dimethyl-8-ribityllumazine synthase